MCWAAMRAALLWAHIVGAGGGFGACARFRTVMEALASERCPHPAFLALEKPARTQPERRSARSRGGTPQPLELYVAAGTDEDSSQNDEPWPLRQPITGTPVEDEAYIGCRSAFLRQAEPQQEIVPNAAIVE